MTAAPPTTPAIRLTGIEKSFGPVRANRGAELEVRQGEIHALVGENGAGKSTLMRILSGMYACDAGTIDNWGFEMGGPNALRNSGWTRETMKIGDEVIVEGSPAKNGTKNVNAKNVTMASTGKKLGAASSQGAEGER